MRIMMIKNGSGEVAVTYFQPTGKYVKLGNGSEYVFRTIRNVCLSWVKETDVDSILNIRHQCCPGSSPKPVFRLSSQQEVNLWTGVGDFHPQ